jgi:uncharacterized UBP type Zn finger protein
MPACPHSETIRDVAPLSHTCEDCAKSGTHPVALRICRVCGHVGCCDSTPGRHARAHFHATGHAIIEPLSAPKKWRWCYVCDAYVDA